MTTKESITKEVWLRADEKKIMQIFKTPNQWIVEVKDYVKGELVRRRQNLYKDYVLALDNFRTSRRNSKAADFTVLTVENYIASYEQLSTYDTLVAKDSEETNGE